MRLRATRFPGMRQGGMLAGLILDALSAPAAAAYSTRKVRDAYAGAAMRVRRSSDNVEADIGFTALGDLDLDALTLHCLAPRRPLLSIAAAAAAFSLRRLGAYSGPAIRVRRSSDNAEADIGFTTAGDLDTTALLAHVGGVNALLWSEDWANAAWAKTGAAVAGKTLTATGGTSGISQTVAYAIGDVSYSVTLLTSGTTSPWVRLAFTDGAATFQAWGNTSTGAIGTVNAGASLSSTAVPGGWRFTLTRTATGTSGTVFIRLALADNNNGAQTGHTLVVDRAQFNAGATAAPYQLTTTAARDGNGFVATWYDQSGNGRNATQATAATQPRIVNAGVVDVRNGRPALIYSGAEVLATASFPGNVSQWHAGVVGHLGAAGNFPRFLSVLGGAQDFDNAASAIPMLMNGGSTTAAINWRSGAQATATITAGVQFIASSWFGATTANLAINGGTPGTNNISVSALAANIRLGIGGRIEASGASVVGSISEIVWVHAALSSTDRGLLELSQAAYYGITYATTIPSGFVTSWYDQSGFARHVSQATAASQPRIVNAGVLDTLGGRPTLVYDGADDILVHNAAFLYAAGASTVAAVLSGAPAIDRRVVAEGRSAGTNPVYSPLQSNQTVGSHSAAFVRNDAGGIAFAATNTVTAGAFNSTANVLTHVDTGSAFSGFLNGAAGNTVSYTRSGVLTMDRFAVGGLQRVTPGSFFSGQLAEITVFPSALSTAERQALERSQGAHFGITVA